MKLFGALVVLLVVNSLPFGAATRAQNMDKAVLNVDEDVTAFAYAPDGRIIFSVRRMFKASKKYELQRDDIWLLETNGKRKRLLEGQKFTHGDKPFTYQVESFTWSPNGHIVAIQLYTSTVDPEDDSREDARALLLLDDNGKELHPKGPDALVTNAGESHVAAGQRIARVSGGGNRAAATVLDAVSVHVGGTANESVRRADVY